jgi:drug/metabolite transporter (DMT)-like permease
VRLGEDMTRPSKSELVLGICIVQFLGAISYPIARYGLINIDPFVFAFFRFLLAGSILFAMTRYKKLTPPIEREDMWKILRLGVLIIGLNQLLFLVGQSKTAAGHGAIMYATQPVWIYLLSMAMGQELFNWRRIGGITCAVIGAVVIVGSAAQSGDTATLTGDIILVYISLRLGWLCSPWPTACAKIRGVASNRLCALVRVAVVRTFRSLVRN